MALAINIPGIGMVLADLDWLSLDTFDGLGAQIRQHGSGRAAKWNYVWRGRDVAYVAFATKHDSKKTPIAAGRIVSQSIEESKFILLVDAGDEQYWLLAVENGLPVPRMDRVADIHVISSILAEYMNSLEKEFITDLPIYTDSDHILEELNLTALSRRMMSLEVIGQSLKKRARSQAKFSRFYKKPIGILVTIPLLIFGMGGYVVYSHISENEARQRAAIQSQQNEARQAQEIALQIKSSLNSLPSVKVAIPAYMATLDNTPSNIHGWKLSGATCGNNQCQLTYDAQPFGTWSGFLTNKPKGWPMPVFGSDIAKITQDIPVVVPASPSRETESLPRYQEIILQLGDMAQTIKTARLGLSFENTSTPLASTPLKNISIPSKSAFTLTGEAYLLSDLAKRFPNSTGLTGFTIRFSNEKSTFELKGEAYARP